MKRIFTLLLAALTVFAFVSCKDNSTSPNNTGGLGGGIGGGGGGGGVTFTMGTTQGQQGGTIFTFRPSTDVTVTTLTLKLPAQQFEDVLTNPNPNEVFNPQTEYSTETEYTGVQSGQQWQFVFVGKLGSSTGTAYTVTANYTIP